MSTIDAARVITRCNDLKRYWSPRNDKAKTWYSLIEMIDELKDKDNKMESFVGNDPRAAYQLVLNLLYQKIPHRIPAEDITIDTAPIAPEIEKTFESLWSEIFENYRRRGTYWLRDFLGYMLATGWYAVFSVMSPDGSKCFAEVWNPMQVYQTWDDELVECAHIFTMYPSQVKRLAARNNWTIHGNIVNNMECRDYWTLEDSGVVYNSIIIGTEIVKDQVPEPRLSRIPIFTAPVGGLPAKSGELTPVGYAERWKEELGQSIVAVNENIHRYWNKWWTFGLNIMRKVAQPKWIEKSRSATRIVKPEEFDKWGAIFKMSPEDDFKPVEMPMIPPELRAMQLDMEAMMQRGGPPWAMYGMLNQQVTAYVMSQISASVSMNARPFLEGTIDMFSDIDNYWLQQMRDYNFHPSGKSLPAKLPKDAKLSAAYEISIPGDVIQRATTARMLAPDFEISSSRVMRILFPDIVNPQQEVAMILADKAAKNPVRSAIALAQSLRMDAVKLRAAGDDYGSNLYNQAADLVESQIAPQQQPPSQPTPQSAPTEGGM